MNLLSIRIEDGLGEFAVKLSKALNMEEILDDATAIVLYRIQSRFLQEKDPDNMYWYPSKAGIERRKAGGTGTLFDTGRLYRSIQLADTSENQRVIGTDVPYGVKHQEGVGTQRRRFLGVNDDDLVLVAARIKERLEENLS